MYKPFNFKNLTGEDIHCLEKCLTFQARIPVSEQVGQYFRLPILSFVHSVY